jgi:hypothetical protein
LPSPSATPPSLALQQPPDLACLPSSLTCGIEREEKEGIERREIGELTCGPKGIFDISHNFSLILNWKLLF